MQTIKVILCPIWNMFVLPWRDKYHVDYICIDKGRLMLNDLEQSWKYGDKVVLVTIAGASM